MINLENFISKHVTERDSSLFEREKQQIRSNRIINHISKSVLAVLLIHGSSIIEPLLASQFNYLRESFSGILLVFFWFVGVVVIFFSINRNRPNKTSVISCI